MAKWEILIAWVPILALFSGCVGSGGSLTAEAPQWHAGYAFSYEAKSSSATATAVNGKTQSETDNEGPERHVMEVLNTTLSSENEPIYLVGSQTQDLTQPAVIEETTGPRADGSASPMPIRTPDTKVYFGGVRQRDLQEVGAWLDIREDCQGQQSSTCDAQVTKLQFGKMPEWTFLEFPLKKGKTWSHSITEGVSDFPDDLEVKLSARVVGAKTVTVPAGKVRAIEVEFWFKPVDINGYIEQVKEEAKKEGTQIDVFKLSMSRHAVAYYSPEYQTLARTDWDSDFSLQVSGKSGTEKFDVSTRGHQTGQNLLTGVKLVPRSERGLDYLARLYLGKASLIDPNGTSLPQVQYGLSVNATKKVVNAAQPEAVQFTANVLEAPRLPDGHTIAWTVRDASSKTVGSGSGASFAYTFSMPGEFTVDAEAHDAQGNLTTSSGVTVAANYQTSSSVACPLVVVVPNSGGCPSVPVPVRPGIQYLRVAATVSGPAEAVPGVNGGQLVLADAAKKQKTDSTRSGNAYEIEMNQFYGNTVNDQNWTLTYAAARGVMESVKYDIDLRYDAPVAIANEFPFGLATGLRTAHTGPLPLI